MIPLECVAALKWSREQGLKLKSLRGKLSRRKLYDKLRDQGVACTPQNIQRIEDGVASTVPLETLLGLCEGVDCKLSDLVPTISISGMS